MRGLREGGELFFGIHEFYWVVSTRAANLYLFFLPGGENEPLDSRRQLFILPFSLGLDGFSGMLNGFQCIPSGSQGMIGHVSRCHRMSNSAGHGNGGGICRFFCDSDGAQGRFSGVADGCVSFFPSLGHLERGFQPRVEGITEEGQNMLRTVASPLHQLVVPCFCERPAPVFSYKPFVSHAWFSG